MFLIGLLYIEFSPAIIQHLCIDVDSVCSLTMLVVRQEVHLACKNVMLQQSVNVFE